MHKQARAWKQRGQAQDLKTGAAACAHIVPRASCCESSLSASSEALPCQQWKNSQKFHTSGAAEQAGAVWPPPLRHSEMKFASHLDHRVAEPALGKLFGAFHEQNNLRIGRTWTKLCTHVTLWRTCGLVAHASAAQEGAEQELQRAWPRLDHKTQYLAKGLGRLRLWGGDSHTLLLFTSLSILARTSGESPAPGAARKNQMGVEERLVSKANTLRSYLEFVCTSRYQLQAHRVWYACARTCTRT